jgi:hypothetical protein
MHLTVHSTKFYDWIPVPENVKVTDADVKSEKVKPSGDGGWLMKVTKAPPGGTWTSVRMVEGQIIAKIIHDKTRPEGGRTLTRAQALAFYLSENVMPHHAHRSWITKVELHDDGPDEKLLRSMLAPHTVSEGSRVRACIEKGTHSYTADGAKMSSSSCALCGHIKTHDDLSMEDMLKDVADVPNIDPAEVEAHVAAYLEPADLVDHLHKHFKVKAVS